MVLMNDIWRTSPWKRILVVTLILAVFSLCDGDYTLTAPAIHVALTGELSVAFQTVQGTPTLSFGVVQLVDITETTDIVRVFKQLPSTSNGNIYFECSFFDRKGEFEFRILTEEDGPVIATSNTVYVYWPMFRIASPMIHVEAFTQDVSVTIYTDEQLCGDMSHNRFETTVTLMYHGGQRTPLTSNELPTPVPTDGILSDEFPTGVLGTEDQVQFYCNAIDRAGHYTFEYQSTFNRSVIARSAFLQVLWSNTYKVTSPQENIFPCQPDNGLEIKYEYPQCRGEHDRIRVFGQKDAFSRQPAPGSLEYITEEGAYDPTEVFFFCEHFSKSYKGYCFTYVSVARNGAVDDHAMICLPTNGTGPPVNGAWSTWSRWGDCTVSCGEGVQYRYRLCNSPTPVNGGAPCLGDTVDTAACPYFTCPTAGAAIVTFPNPDRGINVIPGCNCGCVLREINGTISSSPESCTTGYGSWKVVVPDDLRIKLDFRSFDLYLRDEWLRIRDGEDANARVLAYHTGSKLPEPITSSKNKLFLEYKVSAKETAQMRGFSAVYLTFDNAHYITPVAPIPKVDEVKNEDRNDSGAIGSITHLVLIIAVVFCVFVIVLSVSCTHWAGWKRKKYMIAEGREDSGLTAGFRSSASGHSIERSARCVVQSASSASELSNYSNSKRGCPDGRYMDRSSLYMVKDETGLTYLPESNLSSPSHADLDGSKQLVTIPEDRDLPSSPYQDEEGRDIDEDPRKYEVTLPYHLGPGSVGQLSDRHSVKTDKATDLSSRTPDKHGSRGTLDKQSSRSSHSYRGSQNSMLGSQATGISSRSHRSGSGSTSKYDNSDSSVSRRYYRRSLQSPMSYEEGDLRVLEGSEDPQDVSRGARRKRRSSPSDGSYNSHSSHSHHGSHRSHGSNGHHGKSRHRPRSSDYSKSDDRDYNKSESGRRRHKHDSHPELSQRPTVVGESPTTQVPINLYRHSYHGQQDSNIPSPVAENHASKGEHSRHKSKHRHRSRTPTNETPTTPVTPTNDYVDLAYTTTSANLGPRAPIWPGKSPSTEGVSDTNSRESRTSQNSSNQNRIETTADIEHVERSPSSDGKQKKGGKHKKDRHKRKSKSGGKTSSGSAEDDPKTASRLANHSNGYLNEQDKSDIQSESAHSDPSTVSSPLHFSYLNNINKQRTDYMKSVFISDESLARTHSGDNSAHTSRTATPNMSHRKMPDTPPSGLSSPSKSLTSPTSFSCVPIYDDSDLVSNTPIPAPLADTDAFELDDLTPDTPSPAIDNHKEMTTAVTSPYTKLDKRDKGEAEKSEIVKIGTNDKHENHHSDLNVLNGTNGFNGTTKPIIIGRRTRPPRGPLSSASYV